MERNSQIRQLAAQVETLQAQSAEMREDAVMRCGRAREHLRRIEPTNSPYLLGLNHVAQRS